MSGETESSIIHRQAGWFAWLLLTAAITFAVIFSILMEQERSVTPAYCSAVVNWFEGRPLYNLKGHGFLYLPQAALVFAPWALLPHDLSELVWRWTIIGVMAISAARLTRLLDGDGRWFCAISISSAVLAWGCARNGQSTLLISGLMILAAADLSESRWWRATFLLSLAFAFKPVAIVMILLAAVVYPRVSWRLALGLTVVALAPFATQYPDYVISQYRDCYQSLKVTFDVGESENWAQLFGMLNVAGIPIPSPVRSGIRVIAAAGTLYLCCRAARHLSPQRTAYYLFAFTACYLMLFNSRTEGNTYAMVGPVYGVLMAEAAYLLNSRRATNGLITAVTLSVLNYELAILVTPRPNAIWISPLVCLCVTVYLIARLQQDIDQAAVEFEPVQLPNSTTSTTRRSMAA